MKGKGIWSSTRPDGFQLPVERVLSTGCRSSEPALLGKSISYRVAGEGPGEITQGLGKAEVAVRKAEMTTHLKGTRTFQRKVEGK